MTTRTVTPLVAALAAVCLLAPAAAAEMPTLSLGIADFAPATDTYLTATRVAPVAGLAPEDAREIDLDRLAPPTAGWIIATDGNAAARLEITVAARLPAQPGAGGGGAEWSSAL